MVTPSTTLVPPAPGLDSDALHGMILQRCLLANDVFATDDGLCRRLVATF